MGPDTAADPTPDPPTAAATPPKPARIRLDMDTWCDVTIDGASRDRADPRRFLEVPPGRRRVACAQTGGLRWSEVVDLAPGETRTLKGRLVPTIRVRVALERGDRVRVGTTTYPNGATFPLNQGPHRVEVLQGGTSRAVRQVTFPREKVCTLRDTPELACSPPRP